MKTFLFVLALTAAFSFAKEKKINLRPTGESVKKDDPGSATNLLYADPKKLQEDTAPGKKKNGMLEVRQSCTDPLGMNFQPSDPGYEACLRTIDRAAPTSSQPRGKQSIGFTIK